MALASHVTNLQEVAECTAARAESTADVHHVLVATHAAGDMSVPPLPDALPQTARLAVASHNHIAAQAITQSACRAYPSGTNHATRLSARMGAEVLDLLVRHAPAPTGNVGPQEADAMWLGAPLRAIAGLCMQGVQLPTHSTVPCATSLLSEQGSPSTQAGTDGFLADLLAGIKPSSHTRRGRTVATAAAASPPLKSDSPLASPVAVCGCCLPGGIAEDPSAHHAAMLSVTCSICAVGRAGLLPVADPPLTSVQHPPQGGSSQHAAQAETIEKLALLGKNLGPAVSAVPVSLQVAALVSLSSPTAHTAAPPAALRAAVKAAQAAAAQGTPLTNEACGLLVASLVRSRGSALALRLLESQAMLRPAYLAAAGLHSARVVPDTDAMHGAYTRAAEGKGLPPMPQGRQRGALCWWEVSPLLASSGLASPAAVAQLAALLGRCDVQHAAYASFMDRETVEARCLPLPPLQGLPAPPLTAVAELHEAAVLLCCTPPPSNLDSTAFSDSVRVAALRFSHAIECVLEAAATATPVVATYLRDTADTCGAVVMQRLSNSVHRHEWHAAASIAASALGASASATVLPRVAAAAPSVLSALQRDLAHPGQVHDSMAAVLHAAMPLISVASAAWGGPQAAGSPARHGVHALVGQGHELDNKSCATVVQDDESPVEDVQRALALLAGASAGVQGGGHVMPRGSCHDDLFSSLQALLHAHTRCSFPQHLNKALVAIVARFVSGASGSPQHTADADALVGLCEEAGLLLPVPALAAHIQRLAAQEGEIAAVQAASALAAALPRFAASGGEHLHTARAAAASVISCLLSAAEDISGGAKPGPFDDVEFRVPQALVHDAWLAVSLPFHAHTLPEGRQAWWSARAKQLHPILNFEGNSSASIATTAEAEWKAANQTSPFEAQSKRGGGVYGSFLAWPPRPSQARAFDSTNLIVCAIDVLIASSTALPVEPPTESRSQLGQREAAAVEAWLISQLRLLGTLRHVDGVMHIMTTRHIFGIPASTAFCEALSAAVINRPPNSAASASELPLGIVQNQGIQWAQSWIDENKSGPTMQSVSRGQTWARCVLAVVDTVDAEQPAWSDATYRNFLAFAANRRYAGLSSRLLLRQRYQNTG